MEIRLFLPVLCFTIVVLHPANAEVPAVFILGDSTADVGTNSFLPGSQLRADIPPNGIDFPNSRPTGRFSNGFNSADFLAKLFGFKRSPQPFLFLANKTRALQRPSFRGVNFASGGSGILDLTGQTTSNASANGQKNVVSLSEQIEQFVTVYNNLTAIKGPEKTKAFLAKSLFCISVGSNDIFGYYHSKSSVPKQQFIATLGLAYENHLRNLYKLGARKFGIISIPPIGCCPSQRVFNSTGGCLEDLNQLARDFYVTTNAIMVNLSSQYTDMKYSLGNAYVMTINVIQNPQLFGFKDVQTACCGNGVTFCTPAAKFCWNRNEYLFWDLFHPTQAASNLAAITLYGTGPPFVAPINFKQLAEA